MKDGGASELEIQSLRRQVKNLQAMATRQDDDNIFVNSARPIQFVPEAPRYIETAPVRMASPRVRKSQNFIFQRSPVLQKNADRFEIEEGME